MTEAAKAAPIEMPSPMADGRRPVSKAARITGIVLTTLIPLWMVGVGLAIAIFAPEVGRDSMKHYGYPESVGTPLFIVEVICVILYVIPRTSVLGAILLTGYLGGAVATHVRVGEPWFFPVIFGIIVWLGIYLRDTRVRDLVPLRKA